MQNSTELVPAAPIQDVIDEAAAVEAILNPKPAEQAAPDTGQGGDANPDSEQAETPDTSQKGGIDYALEVPMPNGEPVTIGALKDAYQQQEKRLVEVQQRETAILHRQQELSELARYVEQLPPELVQSVKAQQERYLREQYDLMVEAIPEWKDAAAFKSGRDAIVEMADEYGITDLIQGVADHRLVKFLKDVAELRALVQRGRDKVAPKATAAPKGTAPQQNSATAELESLKAKARAGDELAQVAYIDRLRGVKR
jgi:hypothetical protein